MPMRFPAFIQRRRELKEGGYSPKTTCGAAFYLERGGRRQICRKRKGHKGPHSA